MRKRGIRLLKKNKQYITEDGRKALENVSINRGSRIRNTEQEIYKLLKNEFRESTLYGEKGADRIIYALERRIGKTTAIIELAAELGIPIVVDCYYIVLMKNTINDMRLQDRVSLINLRDLETRFDGRRDMPHTVLIDEGTDVEKVRKALKNLACFRETNIIGIQ